MQQWHEKFDPQRFLNAVDLDSLIEKNEVRNEALVEELSAPCMLCEEKHGSGILLSNHDFLCSLCFKNLAEVSYPEKYERLHRNYLIQHESYRKALEELTRAFEVEKGSGNLLLTIGFWSCVLGFINPLLLFVSLALLVVGGFMSYLTHLRHERWMKKRALWIKRNPEPKKPVLRHFHDPLAELSLNDKLILKVFDYWPGYPPYWHYLREVVLDKDGHSCQVSGCPSRLELHIHHIVPVSKGGAHRPENLVSLCQFHHALEPNKGHERIWGSIRTSFFTLVTGHERHARTSHKTYSVKPHLRRLQLTSLGEIKTISDQYGLSCPSCESSDVAYSIDHSRQSVSVECPKCVKSLSGPQQLTEETGPHLAEILKVTKNRGRWEPRWDMLAERQSRVWGDWSGIAVAQKRRAHRAKVVDIKSAPSCPKCSAPMRLRKPKPGDNWKAFWGCSKFRVTNCKGSRKYK